MYVEGFPLSCTRNSMKCNNPKLCATKYDRWKRNQKRFIPIGEKEHEMFLANKGKITIGFHTDKRQYERVVRASDIKDVITHGWVIERSFFQEEQAVSLVIHGYTRDYRPIHVVCIILDDSHWKVKTVYNPESKKHKWSEDFEERVCFCKENEF